MDVTNLKISAHGWRAMAARDVSPEEVVEILRRPEVVEPHDGRRRFVGKGLAVVVAGDDLSPVVVTVLLRERRQWTSADARAR
jgi:hypothetical protein